MCRRKSFAFLPAFFFFNLDQDDIGTDLADTFPGNDVFVYDVLESSKAIL